FNPLRNVQIDPAINLEELARVAHSLGEVVGLGLRNLATCPVELNLMPASTLKWQSFNQKKPYFIASVFSLVLVIFAIAFLFDKLATNTTAIQEDTHRQVEPLQLRSQQFEKAYRDLEKTQKDVEQVVGWMNDRYFWSDVMGEMRQVLIRVEAGMKSKLRTDTGIWIEMFQTAAPRGGADASASYQATPEAAPVVTAEMEAQQAAFRRRYGLSAQPTAQPSAEVPPGGAAPDPAATAATTRSKKSKGDTNEVATITFTFRAVSLSSVRPEANKETAFSVLNEIRNSPLFDPDPEETKFNGDVGNEEPPGTFTFGIIARLKRPLKL
ncbi:MAG TPA: hypothetical protein VNT26_17300, partial [Candidatus Sulfotelmatobacter sp.]|nr:hypothetical protein [Candidatus Sulfotelmatobacter sp.]